MSQSNIESVLNEARVFAPDPQFSRIAQIGNDALDALHQRAEEDPVGYWADLARTEIVWRKPFTQTLDDSAAPNYQIGRAHV